MKEENKIEEAVEYATSSNELENNPLYEDEIDKIIKDIKSGKSDESFLWSIAELARKIEKEKQMKKEEERNALRK